MSSVNQLYIGGASALTPIGGDLATIQGSIATSLNAFQLTDVFDEENNLIKMSLVPTVAINQSAAATGEALTPRQNRMLSFAVHALEALTPSLPETPLPLFLAGPESYVNIPGINGPLIKNLAASTSANIDVASSRFVNVGRAGAMEAIEIAFKYMSFAQNHYAIVGGVDCFYDYRVMQYLYDRFRVMRPGAYDAFIPGEGAGMLLLVSPNAPREVLEALKHGVTRPVMRQEPGHLMGGKGYRADALPQLFHAALASQSAPVKQIISTENGEMHYAKEFMVARIRNAKKIHPEAEVSRVAEFVGDVGAASTFISLALLNHEAEPTASLVYSSSDSGLRGALCVNVRPS